MRVEDSVIDCHRLDQSAAEPAALPVCDLSFMTAPRSKMDMGCSRAGTSGGRTISKRLRIDRKRIVVTHLTWVID